MPVTTVAVATGGGIVATAAAATLMLRRRPRDVAPAARAQAPVHTAMTMMVTQIPMQQSGMRTAMTIPAITALVMALVRSANKRET